MKLSDLKNLNTKQLREIVARAQELIEERRTEELKEGRAKIAAMAKELGISVNELLGMKNGKKTASAATKPKYRSKADPSLTWSGRGRMATWLAEEIKAGKSKDSFLIKD